MNVAILYFSRYGTGKMCMEELKGMLEQRAARVEMSSVTGMDTNKLPAADIYVFSAPTEAFGIAADMKMFLRGLKAHEGARYALFNTHGLKKPRALPKMEKILKKKGMVLVAKANSQVEGSGESVRVKDGYRQQLESIADALIPKGQ